MVDFKKHFKYCLTLLIPLLFLSYSSAWLMETGSFFPLDSQDEHSYFIDKSTLVKCSKDFTIENGNQYTSSTGDPWIYIENIIHQPKYISINVDSLVNEPGISQVFYDEKTMDFEIEDGINVVKVPDEAIFTALRFDLVSFENVSFKLNYIKFSDYPPLLYAPIVTDTCIISAVLLMLLTICWIIIDRQKHSKLQSAYAITFILILLLPNILFFIFEDRVDNTNTENRTLIDKPELKAKNILDYPTEYESYTNDHLAFKNQFVRLNTIININFFNFIDSKVAILGEENWLFYNHSNYIVDYKGINHYTDEELERKLKDIELFKDNLKIKGIKFALMITPNKASVYPEYMPDDIKVVNQLKRSDQLVQYFEQNSDINIIKSKEALISIKENSPYNLYFKYGTHWNQVGAFIGSQQLSEALLGHKADLGTLEVDQFDYKVQPIGVPADNDDYKLQVNGYLPHIQVGLVENSSNNYYMKFSSTSENDQHLLVIRDSFSENMFPYITKLYKETTFIHLNMFTPDMIDQENPDVVVLEFVERDTNHWFHIIETKFLPQFSQNLEL